MNFVTHEKTLKGFLHTEGNKPYSGNYIYSRDEHDKTHKIGMSQAGLWQRLKQAKSCYPFEHEFWIKYIIISLDGQKQKTGKSTTLTVENALHRASKHLSTVNVESMPKKKKEEGKRPREYRVFAKPYDLHKLLKDTLNENRNSWDYLVVFNTDGWKILPNDRSIENVKKLPIKSTAQLQPLVVQTRATDNKRPRISSMPINNTMLTERKYEVGDKVPASDNWKSFTVTKVISKNHIVAKFGKNSKEYDIVF